MRALRPAVIVILVFVALFVFWAYGRLTAMDRIMSLSNSVLIESSDSAPDFIADSLHALDGRMLVWSTNANVPLKLAARGEAHGVLELLGVPEFLRQSDLQVGREPARSEWNIASIRIETGKGSENTRFYTLGEGTFVHPAPTPDGAWIFATRHIDAQEDIVGVQVSTGDLDVVGFSHSKDRWPSCSGDGSHVCFHSYRDGNPGGDLYLIAEDADQPDGWRVIRLTDNPDVECVWPFMAGDMNACVAVERQVGSESGRVVYWSLEDESLGESIYLTEPDRDVKLPSLNASGTLCCWQEQVGGQYEVFLWSASEGARMLEIGLSRDIACYGLVHPRLSPDGRFIVYIEDYREPEDDRFGIFDIELGVCHYFDGCEGNLLYPALTDRIAGDDR